MSTTITIQGNIIEFPTSADSPNWASAIVDFAQAVEDALSGLAGTYDVAPQVYTISSDINSATDVPLLSFPTANVRGAFIRYALYRTSNTTTEVECGNLEVVYNTGAGSWQISRDAVGTNSTVTFTITNTGQVQFESTAIGGTYSTGKLTYSAQAMLNA